MTMALSRLHFRAYASKKQVVVVFAALAPMLTGMGWTLVINSTYPMGIRLSFATILGVFALVLVAPMHRFFTRGPMFEVSEAGLLWRGWSTETISWDAMKRWKSTSYFGVRYITIWLHEPHQHRATTAARWTQSVNGWFGHGDISISAGGLNKSFDQVAQAFDHFHGSSARGSQNRAANS